MFRASSSNPLFASPIMIEFHDKVSFSFISSNTCSASCALPHFEYMSIREFSITRSALILCLFT
uniref:Uncharacterized protein n=1 Tax=Arundo donax TaxID=35708 RepID=A0A0A9D3I1_ARUDO